MAAGIVGLGQKLIGWDASGDLADAVAATSDDPRREARQRVVADLFGPPTGDDDRRAAAEIAALVRRLGRPHSRRATAPVWKGAYRVARRAGR